VNKAVLEIAPLFELPVAAAEDLELLVERVESAFAEPEGKTDGVLSVATAGAAVEDPPRVDALTGLAGRAQFDAYLGEQFELAQKVGKPLSVVLLDPDHFDMINQTFGRQAGDRALRALGTLVGERLRFRDLAARYGGEALALVLTDTHAAGAAIVAERLRKKIEEALHDIGIGDPVRMTISAGCVTLDESLGFPGPAELLACAERTLAEAKRAGRNRVVSFGSLPAAA
jgi:diguanylate cyclase (GGDEF)-like protein